MALNLCLLFATWNVTPNHEGHDSMRKKATMTSCYSLQPINTSVKWNCTINAIIETPPSHPFATSLQTWAGIVLYGEAMRNLKGGRLFEYVRLESVFLLLWFWVCAWVLSRWNTAPNREKHAWKKLPCTAATHCNQSIQMLNGIAQRTQSFNLCLRIPSQHHCRPGRRPRYFSKHLT